MNRQRNDFASPKTRRSEQAGNCSASCFFCEDAGGSLHECQTLHLANQVHKIAEALCNTKDDMIAAEAKYHLKCLTNSYNTYRNHVSSKPLHCSDKERYKGIDFLEDINFVEDTLDHIEGGVPVFKLCELVNMYRKELERYNVSENVHVTRFKQRIFDNVPCLSESKVGRIVVLTVTDEVGHALIKTCSDEDDGIILSKAARIIRRSLLSIDEVFNDVYNGVFKRTAYSLSSI